MLRNAVDLYERSASARISDALIQDAIELTVTSLPVNDRVEIQDRLLDEDHAAVLRKEVSDVVILVTSAMEAPTTTVYRDVVALVVPEPFDEVTAPLKTCLMRKMAFDALDEVDEALEALVLDLLNIGLRACGDAAPLVWHAHASVE